jgi:crossover junction endodeoxyribonuclease RuvC
MSRTRVILGIDPGIADTGYGVITVSGSTVRCLTYGSIKTSSKSALMTRLGELHQELLLILDAYQPDLVSVEELFFSKNVKTAITVGEARGVILLTLQERGCSLVEFKPSQVKQAVAAYGAATKDQVQQMVKSILGLKTIPKPDDAADALALAICALNKPLIR